MRRYLIQLSTFIAPRSVEAADHGRRTAGIVSFLRAAGWLPHGRPLPAALDGAALAGFAIR